MIYIDDNPRRFTPEEITSMIQRFPRQRREGLCRCANEAVRRQGALAYSLLCRGLRREYGIAEPPEFHYGEHGKPSLAQHPGIHFNLSHCKAAVACAISDRPVGIDIEGIREAKPPLVRHTMSEREAHLILSSPDPDLEFTLLWTRKEALLKWAGRGIAADMRDVLAGPHPAIVTTVCGPYVYSIVNP